MTGKTLNTLQEAEPGWTVADDRQKKSSTGDYRFFFWKGRVALYAILRALGVGPGDHVLVPGYTCVVVPGAICFLGAKPQYVDIDPNTYNISLNRIEAAVRPDGPRIKAVIVQHTYGLPTDTAPIVKWARQRGIAVVEDCCHSLGSRYLGEAGDWQDAGTLGNAAFFSSQWSKPVTTGLGGWAVTSSPSLADKIELIHANECISPSWAERTALAAQVAGRSFVSSPSSFWLAQTTYRFLGRAGLAIGSSAEAELRGQMPPGYAKRMSSFQLRLLSRKLARFAGGIPHRRRLRTVYDRALTSAGLRALEVPQQVDPVLLRYPVRVRNKREILDAARSSRVELGDWFDHPLHPKESDARAFGYREGMCPNAEEAASQVINLPVHDRVSEEAARKMVSFLKDVAQPVE
ncbi:MAG: DegT/DnrJ/EryC1/StrS family aminotransferase [Terriglobales bacterium]|jgi:perosamine synthetase